MAKILDIKYDQEKLPRYKVYFNLENPTIAKYLSEKYRGFVRQLGRALKLDSKGSILILDGPIVDEDGIINDLKKKKVEEVACRLKNTIEKDML